MTDLEIIELALHRAKPVAGSSAVKRMIAEALDRALDSIREGREARTKAAVARPLDADGVVLSEAVLVEIYEAEESGHTLEDTARIAIAAYLRHEGLGGLGR